MYCLTSLRALNEVGIMEVGAAGVAEMQMVRKFRRTRQLCVGSVETGQPVQLKLREGGMAIRTTVSKDLSPQQRFKSRQAACSSEVVAG